MAWDFSTEPEFRHGDVQRLAQGVLGPGVERVAYPRPVEGDGGRDEDRIAFGDDAAVAGGLTGLDRVGDPVFLGDALADPVTGVFAAHAVAHSLADGGGELLSLPMAGCAAALIDSR